MLKCNARSDLMRSRESCIEHSYKNLVLARCFSARSEMHLAKCTNAPVELPHSLACVRLCYPMHRKGFVTPRTPSGHPFNHHVHSVALRLGALHLQSYSVLHASGRDCYSKGSGLQRGCVHVSCVHTCVVLPRLESTFGV